MSNTQTKQQDTDFSILSIKKSIKTITDKRVGKSSVLELRSHIQELVEDRSREAIEEMKKDDRVTVRREDVKNSRSSSPGKHSFTIPNAPVERVLRKQGAERVSDGAVEELKTEAIHEIYSVSVEADRIAGHAELRTITDDSVKLALKD